MKPDESVRNSKRPTLPVGGEAALNNRPGGDSSQIARRVSETAAGRRLRDTAARGRRVFAALAPHRRLPRSRRRGTCPSRSRRKRPGSRSRCTGARPRRALFRAAAWTGAARRAPYYDFKLEASDSRRRQGLAWVHARRGQLNGCHHDESRIPKKAPGTSRTSPVDSSSEGRYDRVQRFLNI